MFVDARLEEIESAVRAVGLTGVQLHFAAGRELPGKLRARLGPALRILRVMHFEADDARSDVKAQLAECAAENPDVDGVLVDSRTAKAVGGTGVAFDWAAARRRCLQGQRLQAPDCGGRIDAGQCGSSDCRAKPWGVDVVSGVEAAPGRKDAAKVREFVKRAPGRRQKK